MKIDIDNAKEINTLSGFGASAAWWSTGVETKEAAEDMASLLYGDDGLKLNIYRYNVGGGFEKDNCRVGNKWRAIESFMNKDGSYDYTKDKNAVRVMDECLKTGNVDTLIFFANSPHYTFTHSNQASGGLTEHFSNLKKECYDDFANYFLDITEHFINEGYPVKYISPINEPQWKWGGDNVWQEGCHYEPKEVRDCLHAFAVALEKRKTPVLLYAPESGCISDHTKEYFDLMAEDELIMKHLGVFAYHSYHSDDDAKSKRDFRPTVRKWLGKIPYDMSEWCELPCKFDTKDVRGLLKMVRIIGEDLILSGAKSWTAWVAANQIGPASRNDKCYSDGLIAANDDFSYYYIAKRYYALKHFSSFIPVGSKSFETGLEESQRLSTFLFKTPNGKNVIVASNESKKSRIIELQKKYDTIEIYKSNSTDTFKKETIHNEKKIVINSAEAMTIVF